MNWPGIAADKPEGGPITRSQAAAIGVTVAPGKSPKPNDMDADGVTTSSPGKISTKAGEDSDDTDPTKGKNP